MNPLVEEARAVADKTERVPNQVGWKRFGSLEGEMAAGDVAKILKANAELVNIVRRIADALEAAEGKLDALRTHLPELRALDEAGKKATGGEWGAEFDDLRGIAPDATGDMSSEDFIAERRDGWGER